MRWRSSALVFVGTVALSVVVLGAQARFYFTDLLGDAGRVGPSRQPMNQSLRGMLGYSSATTRDTDRCSWAPSRSQRW